MSALSQAGLGSAMVRFEPMNEREYAAFMEWLERDYARAHVEAGTWSPEGATAMARAETAKLLPKGRETPDQYVFKVLDETGSRVGNVWYALQSAGGRKSIWIFWIGVDESFRRRGLGSEILHAVEAEAGRLGATQVGLHVFAKNAPARALYERIGFQAAGIIMRKNLAG